MRGGGIVHGPKPRDYSQDTPRKMRQSAFRTAPTRACQNDAIFVLDGLNMDAPRPKNWWRCWAPCNWRQEIADC